jgi:hypothetical protein
MLALQMTKNNSATELYNNFIKEGHFGKARKHSMLVHRRFTNGDGYQQKPPQQTPQTAAKTAALSDFNETQNRYTPQQN